MASLYVKPEPPVGYLNVHLIGNFELSVEGRRIDIPSRKAQALLGYLALSESGTETRERLVGLLWSESDQSRARASLRQVNRVIKSAFKDGKVGAYHSDNDSIALERRMVRVDVSVLIEELEAGRVPTQVFVQQRLTDNLFRDISSVDPAFEIWALAKRQSLSNVLTTRLEDGLRNDNRTMADRAQLAQALINLDPTHEEAARELIRIKAQSSDVGGALSIYNALWKTLDEEYDVEPSAKTQELAVRVKLGELRGSESGTATGVSDPPPMVEQFNPTASQLLPASGPQMDKLLVLSLSALDTQGVGAERQYLVQGFRRELLACLVRFREWAVQETHVLGQRRGCNHAEYVIEGSVFDIGDRLRFVLVLRDVQTDQFLWSDNVDVDLENWFDAQQLVIKRVTTALNVNLSVKRLAAISAEQPIDLNAFDLWLLGQATFFSFDQQRWQIAEKHFREVIEQMPGFAPVHSALAQLYNSEHIVMPGVFRDSQRTARALACAREAARLDPLDSRGQLCLGWSHAMSKHYEQAMIYIPLAYDLNSNDPWTMVSSANCLAFCGRYAQATSIAERVLNLPLAPSNLQWSYHVAIRFLCSDYEGCIDAAKSAADVNPNVPGYKAAALYHLGRCEAAAREFDRFVDVARKRWVGESEPTVAAISRWFLTMFPIARPEDWSRLRDGLGGAGAPTEGLDHNDW